MFALARSPPTFKRTGSRLSLTGILQAGVKETVRAARTLAVSQSPVSAAHFSFTLLLKQGWC